MNLRIKNNDILPLVITDEKKIKTSLDVNNGDNGKNLDETWSYIKLIVH